MSQHLAKDFLTKKNIPLTENIFENQNKPESIKLLKASTFAYSEAKGWENTISFVLIFLSFAYPISFVFIKDESVKLSLFGVSFCLTVFIQVFSIVFKTNTSKGALIKEEFDTKVFGLPWKTTLTPIDKADISKLAISYKGKEIIDWYSPLISKEIPSNILIAVCQRINTGWDIELRISYRNILRMLLIVYSIALGIFNVVYNVDGKTLFGICFSILSFYTHFITIIRGHSTVIDKRKAINKLLDNFIFNKETPTTQQLRDIQDEIYATRQEPAKVPNLFFNIFKKKLNREFDDFVTDINSRY